MTKNGTLEMTKNGTLEMTMHTSHFSLLTSHFSLLNSEGFYERGKALRKRAGNRNAVLSL